MNNLIKAADELAGAIDDERNMVCQDFGMQQDASLRTDTALTAYRTARNEQGEVKVKPLVWELTTFGFQADGITGRYEVYASIMSEWWLWRGEHGIALDQYDGREAGPDEAKAAAQADYETRIRSALEE